MKIIVCMKQVPASSKVDIDPETGNLRGEAQDSAPIRMISTRWSARCKSVKKPAVPLRC
ncbi:MAG: hypothetical protein V8S58_05160 [Lachnospiraceae bacterium]